MKTFFGIQSIDGAIVVFHNFIIFEAWASAPLPSNLKILHIWVHNIMWGDFPIIIYHTFHHNSHLISQWFHHSSTTTTTKFIDFTMYELNTLLCIGLKLQVIKSVKIHTSKVNMSDTYFQCKNCYKDLESNAILKHLSQKPKCKDKCTELGIH